MRLSVIANPGSGTAPAADRLEALLGADGGEVLFVAIESISDRESGSLLDGAVVALTAAGVPDRVVVAGGDGSIGPAALCAAELGVPLAVVPVGTANDFARTKHLPLDLEDACALARDPLAATAPAELALAGVRPFVNAAAAGLSVVAARAATPLKARLGPLAYPVGAIRAGITATPLRCTVDCDGEEAFAGDAWQVIVAATGAFGGGSEIGGTRPTDRLLDVAVIPAGLRIGLARRAIGMRIGRLVRQAGIVHRRGAVISVAADGRAEFNVDGEMWRDDPARFALHPTGFDLVTPPS